MVPGTKWSSGSGSQQGPEHKQTPPLLSEMQKTTYYDNSSTLFGGYSSYQVQGAAAAAAANGFGGYDAPVPVSHHQPAFQSAAHLDVDSYHRSACSLQSLGNNSSQQQQQQQLAKTKELNGSCMRPSLPPEHHPGSQVSPPLAPNPSNSNNRAQPGGSAAASSVSKSGPDKSSNSSSSISSSSSSSLPPNPALAKQIFPWMKECRQTTKQKNCSPSNNSGNGVLDYTYLSVSVCPSVCPHTHTHPHHTETAWLIQLFLTQVSLSLILITPLLLSFCFSLLSFSLLVIVFVFIISPLPSHHHIPLSSPLLSPSSLKIPRGLKGFYRQWIRQGNHWR